MYQKAFYECSGAISIFQKPVQDFEGFIQKNKDDAFDFCSGRLSELKKAVNRKSVSYDGAKAYQYLEKAQDLLSATCENFTKKSLLATLYENLNAVLGKETFRGMIPEGGECYIENECSDGLYCGGKSCPGVCTKLEKVGGKCESYEQCESGLICYPDICTYTSATTCRSSSDCPNSQSCLEGVCTAFKVKGEFCENADECEYSCDFQSKKCIDYKFVDYGKTCGMIGGDIVYCLKGSCVSKENSSLCEPYGKENEQCSSKNCDLGFLCSSDGTCKKLSKEGQPCGFSCGYGLYCDNGVCKKKKELGEVCISGQECRTETCSDGKCFDKRQNVKACDQDSDCINWNCLNNNCCNFQ